MIECWGFFEPTHAKGPVDLCPDKGCHFITPALVAVGVGADTAAILGPVIGAGLGAAGSAATGGNPLTGALLGGGLSLAGGLTGLTGGIGDALGTGSTDLSGALSNTLGFGASGSGALSGLSTDVPGPASSTATDLGSTVDSSNPFGLTGGGGVGNQISTSASDLAGLGPLGQTAGTAATGGLSGINKNLMLLAGVSGLGSLFGGKPQVYSGPMPGPSSTAATAGPYFNQPLQTYSGTTRTAQNPFAGQPTSAWYTAGEQPEQTYFTNNNLGSYGWNNGQPVTGAAHGGSIHHGALARGGAAFSTENDEHLVRGGGDGTSDAVPAKLSDGEYVLTALDVARLGQGSNEAGAKKLDQFRKQLAQKTGQKQFIPAKARGALSQLIKKAA